MIRRVGTRSARANGGGESREGSSRDQREARARSSVALIPLQIQPAELPPRFVAMIDPQRRAVGARAC